MWDDEQEKWYFSVVDVVAVLTDSPDPKRYWSKVLKEQPLKIHHLSRLAAKSGLIEELSEEQLSFIDLLEPLNIEARYPSYKDKLMKNMTLEYCKELLEKTKSLQLWIKKRL